MYSKFTQMSEMGDESALQCRQCLYVYGNGFRNLVTKDLSLTLFNFFHIKVHHKNAHNIFSPKDLKNYRKFLSQINSLNILSITIFLEIYFIKLY